MEEEPEEQEEGINRNIMECKVGRLNCKVCAPPGINRNIMECKVTVKSGFPCLATVLIETLWNVKFGPLMFTVSGLAY